MKQCTKCKEWKDETEFPKDKYKKDGLCTRCKQCVNDAYRERYYKDEKEKERLKQKGKITKNIIRNIAKKKIQRRT